MDLGEKLEIGWESGSQFNATSYFASTSSVLLEDFISRWYTVPPHEFMVLARRVTRCWPSRDIGSGSRGGMLFLRVTSVVFGKRKDLRLDNGSSILQQLVDITEVDD